MTTSRYPMPAFDEAVVYRYDSQFRDEYYESGFDALAYGDYGGAGTVGVANLRWYEEAIDQDGLVLGVNLWDLDLVSALIRDGAEYEEAGATFGALPVVIRRHGWYSSSWLEIRRDFAGAHDSDIPDLAARTVAAHGIEDPDGDVADALVGLVRALLGTRDYPLIDDDLEAEVRGEWEDEWWENSFDTAVLRDWCGATVASAYDEGLLPLDVVRHHLWRGDAYFEYENSYAYPVVSDAESLRESLRDWLDYERPGWLATLQVDPTVDLDEADCPDEPDTDPDEEATP